MKADQDQFNYSAKALITDTSARPNALELNQLEAAPSTASRSCADSRPSAQRDASPYPQRRLNLMACALALPGAHPTRCSGRRVVVVSVVVTSVRVRCEMGK